MTGERIRYPVVAGKFYEGNRSGLVQELDELYGETINVPDKYINPTGLIVPHAGYVYSGKTAAMGYKKVFKTGKLKTAVIIGPNHTGVGKPISIYPQGKWETPFGDIEIDEELSKFLCDKLGIQPDEQAHLYEHSLEVQLPFIQYFFDDTFKIVPIVMGVQNEKTAAMLGNIMKELKKEGMLFIASTDLNHYESQEVTLHKDRKVIECIEKMNFQKMYENIREYDITMCGYGPVSVLMNMGFSKTEIIAHKTSGEAFGEYSRVVGYLSAILEN